MPISSDIERHRDLLTADLMFAADGPGHLSNRPIVFFGMRGNLKMELEENLGIAEFAGPKDLSYYEKIMFQPTLNITVRSFFDGIRASVLVLQRFAAMPRAEVERGLREHGTSGGPSDGTH